MIRYGMKSLIHGNALGAGIVIVGRIANDTLIKQRLKRKRFRSERSLTGRIDKRWIMLADAIDRHARATLPSVRVDPVGRAQRNYVKTPRATERLQPLDREVGDGGIFIDEDRFEKTVEPIQRIFIEVRDDQGEHLVHAQNCVAPRHCNLASIVCPRLGQVALRPDEIVRRDTFGKIAIGEVF